LLGRKRWVEVDAQDPGKQLANEVVSTVGAGIVKVSQNGFSLRGLTSTVRNRLGRRSNQPESGPKA
ncbi:MAG: hypothetical protein L0312_04260, partial [Acidobacteria bacterium]|nr:hypothetical protein [Acidobacteriota bacterium]